MMMHESVFEFFYRSNIWKFVILLRPLFSINVINNIGTRKVTNQSIAETDLSM